MKLKRYRQSHGTTNAKRIGILCEQALFNEFKKKCKAENTLISDKIRELMSTHVDAK